MAVNVLNIVDFVMSINIADKNQTYDRTYTESLRKRVKKQRDAICSATADWAQWSSAWRECWSTGRARKGKEEGIDGWMEGGREGGRRGGR